LLLLPIALLQDPMNEPGISPQTLLVLG